MENYVDIHIYFELLETKLKNELIILFLTELTKLTI